MTASTAFLRGASYVLGEHEADFTAPAIVAELSERFAMAPSPGLWGWGSVRTTGGRIGRSLLHAACVGSLRCPECWSMGAGVSALDGPTASHRDITPG